MSPLERLIAIEEIKALKGRYWRAVDTRDAALLRSLFTDDALIPFHGREDEGSRNIEEFVANTINALSGTVSAHSGTGAEISFVSDNEATGIWGMEDHIWKVDDNAPFAYRHMNGWGHYHDVYRRTEQGWKIQTFILKRSRIETA